MLLFSELTKHKQTHWCRKLQFTHLFAVVSEPRSRLRWLIAHDYGWHFFESQNAIKGIGSSSILPLRTCSCCYNNVYLWLLQWRNSSTSMCIVEERCKMRRRKASSFSSFFPSSSSSILARISFLCTSSVAKWSRHTSAYLWWRGTWFRSATE